MIGPDTTIAQLFELFALFRGKDSDSDSDRLTRLPWGGWVNLRFVTSVSLFQYNEDAGARFGLSLLDHNGTRVGGEARADDAVTREVAQATADLIGFYCADPDECPKQIDWADENRPTH